jgi:hypothetical protein
MTVACRGVHFALSAAQARRLTETLELGDVNLLAFVEEVEREWNREWLLETDKSWDAIHRCLTDGQLHWGDTPFHKCILGTHNFHAGDDYLVNYLAPNEVKEVAGVIKSIDRYWLRCKYDAIDTETYGDLSDDDFEYTWGSFPHLRDFFQKAATADRAMIFTVDQ